MTRRMLWRACLPLAGAPEGGRNKTASSQRSNRAQTRRGATAPAPVAAAAAAVAVAVTLRGAAGPAHRIAHGVRAIWLRTWLCPTWPTSAAHSPASIRPTCTVTTERTWLTSTRAAGGNHKGGQRGPVELPRASTPSRQWSTGAGAKGGTGATGRLSTRARTLSQAVPWKASSMVTGMSSRSPFRTRMRPSTGSSPCPAAGAKTAGRAATRTHPEDGPALRRPGSAKWRTKTTVRWTPGGAGSASAWPPTCGFGS